MKKHKFKLVPFFIVAVFLILITPSIKAQTADNNSDAIGVRIIPNPNHYSVYRWYESQGFSGSPQSLTVDGYEALRDGRTVYVNAANADTNAKVIYTNIYLISYNQEPSVKTVDILGQIISHWKFNDNLPLEVSTCSISAIKCEQDSDCASNQTCSLNSGTCTLKELKNCSVDEDCPASFFCASLKAKIIRDLKRVGKVEEIKEALASYRKVNGRYPLLSAGTYLKGKSVSLWPSWNDVLIPALAVKQNIIDPINSLGACPGFNPKTCWDNNIKKFVYDPVGASLKLPKDSYAFVYGTNDSGSDYNLCAVLETHSGPNYTFAPNDPTSSNCVTDTGILNTGNSSNSAPRITNLSLKGISGTEYNGFVKAVDDDNDPLTWSIQPLTLSWPNWQGAPPIIKSTSDNSQKKIFASLAGNSGNYPISITVRDSQGASVSTTTSIEISSASSFAQADDYTYRLDPTIPFNYSFYVAGGSATPQYSLTLITGPNVLSMSGIVRTVTTDGLNRRKINYQGIISTTTKFAASTESRYRLSVNSGGVVSNNEFTIKIDVDKPLLNLNCAAQSRLNYPYSCVLGPVKQGNHDLAYTITSAMPAGLSVTANSSSGLVYLSGNTVQFRVGQEIRVNVVNEYGTVTEKSFVLNVNTYCGDGVKEYPNSEGKGGVRNDGYEACDGGADVATTAAASSKIKQYACHTFSIGNTPNPITTNTYCIFKSPLDGGGYCGDTYCQTKYENKTNCSFDCDPDYYGDKNNLSDGKDVKLDCNNGAYCQPGYQCTSAGVCEKKCWPKLEKTHEVLVRGGDAIRANVTYSTKVDSWKDYKYSSATLSGFVDGVSTKICTQKDNASMLSGALGCSVIRLDNPECTGTTVTCPFGTNTSTKLTTDTGGQCVDTGGLFNGWYDRLNYTCARITDVTRCFQDDCRTNGSSSLDGSMNEDGVCVKKPPVRYCETTAECFNGEECKNVINGCYSISDSFNEEFADCNSLPSKEACDSDSQNCEWRVVQRGACVPKTTDACVPNCPANSCGTDGCGGTCSCPSSDYNCTNNQCIAIPTCPAGTLNNYAYPAMKYGEIAVAKKNPCYRTDGGYYEATANCSNSGVVTITNPITQLECYTGYRYTSGGYYQTKFGCYYVCLLNCEAGNVDGYDHGALESNGPNSQALVSKTIAGGVTCSAKASCEDGKVTITEEVCN